MRVIVDVLQLIPICWGSCNPFESSDHRFFGPKKLQVHCMFFSMGFTARKRARDEPTRAVQSHLGQWLLEELAWGGVSAAQVQKIAALAVLDMENPPADLQVYASLGSSGLFVNNIWRDLQRHLGENNFPALKSLEVPLKFGKDYRDGILPCLWPHELFASLFHDYPGEWDLLITPGERPIESFWQQVQHTDLFAQHPISSGRRDLRKCASNSNVGFKNIVHSCF